MKIMLRNFNNYGRLIVLLVSVFIAALPGTLLAMEKEDVRVAGLIEGAKKEGKLIIYGGGAAETYNAIIRQFQKRYPFIKTELYRSTASTTLIRILNEAKAKRYIPDVFTLGALQMYVVKKNGLIAKYISPEREAYREDMKDKEGYYTTFSYATNVMAYNTRLVSPADAPKSLEDLLNPRWKGKLGLPINGEKWFTSLMKNLGEERARAFSKKLALQEPILRNGVALNTMLLSAGEFPVLVNSYGWMVEEKKAAGSPIEWVRAEPILTDDVSISLATHNSHPNSARLFIDWLLSLEGQQVLRGLFRIPGRSEVEPDPPRLTRGLKLFPFNPDWGADYARYEEEYRTIFLKKQR